MKNFAGKTNNNKSAAQDRTNSGYCINCPFALASYNFKKGNIFRCIANF